MLELVQAIRSLRMVSCCAAERLLTLGIQLTRASSNDLLTFHTCDRGLKPDQNSAPVTNSTAVFFFTVSGLSNCAALDSGISAAPLIT